MLGPKSLCALWATLSIAALHGCGSTQPVLQSATLELEDSSSTSLRLHYEGGRLAGGTHTLKGDEQAALTIEIDAQGRLLRIAGTPEGDQEYAYSSNAVLVTSSFGAISYDLEGGRVVRYRPPGGSDDSGTEVTYTDNSVTIGARVVRREGDICSAGSMTGFGGDIEYSCFGSTSTIRDSNGAQGSADVWKLKRNAEGLVTQATWTTDGRVIERWSLTWQDSPDLSPPWVLGASRLGRFIDPHGHQTLDPGWFSLSIFELLARR